MVFQIHPQRMVEICQSVNEQTDEPPCNGSGNIVWIPIAWMRNPCRGMPHDQSSCRPTSHHQVSARDGDDWYDDGHREVSGEDRGLSLAQQDDGFVHHGRECGEAAKETRSK